ncbi:MAG: nitrous oxide reductase family maturation protein NosD [Phycisphaerales bacterium JB038]
MTRKTTIRLAALLALAPTTAADIIDVPADWPMIQMAINAANDGDEIVVQPGEYVEHLNLLGKEITIRSVDPLNPIIVDLTRVVGPAAAPRVQCVSGETADTVLRGLTITHLSPAASDHGMHTYDSYPIVEYCVFLDNHSADMGGGLLVGFPSIPVIRHCVFRGNSAVLGGGICVDWSNYVVIEDCTFEDNVASEDGGGVYLAECLCTTRRCSFDGNTADRGGGLFLNDVYEQNVVDECTFTSNNAFTNGGGAYIRRGDAWPLTSCVFEQNTAEKGAGLYTYQAIATISACDFLGNIASNRGGGVYNNESTPTYVDCTFVGNDAGVDGGMRNWESQPIVVDCSFAGVDGDSSVDSMGGVTWQLTAPPITPPVMGACCLGSYCVVTTEGECVAAGGAYHGDYTTCADVTCPEDCLGDLNGDGVIGQADLGILLSVYGQDCP